MSKAEALVLFDIDGTLLTKAGAEHRLALIEGIRRVTGISTSFNGITPTGMLDRDIISLMMRSAGASERAIKGGMREIVRECQAVYARACSESLMDRVCPGIVPFVRNLRDRGAVLGVVTGNLSQIGWRKLELAGLREFFALGAFAEDGRTRVRLAKIAAQRARKLGMVSKTARVSLIGDHPNDVAAAQANGFQSIAVATGLIPIEQLQATGADFVVPTVEDLNLADVAISANIASEQGCPKGTEITTGESV